MLFFAHASLGLNGTIYPYRGLFTINRILLFGKLLHNTTLIFRKQKNHEQIHQNSRLIPTANSFFLFSTEQKR